MQYQIMADSIEINAKNVKEWVAEFKNNILPQRKKFGEYYDGKNCIVKQGAAKGRPNYSINVNMAKYIIDVATGYAFGNPVKYSTDEENATEILRKTVFEKRNFCTK